MGKDKKKLITVLLFVKIVLSFLLFSNFEIHKKLDDKNYRKYTKKHPKGRVRTDELIEYRFTI